MFPLKFIRDTGTYDYYVVDASCGRVAIWLDENAEPQVIAMTLRMPESKAFKARKSSAGAFLITVATVRG